MTHNKKNASLFALSILTACGTKQPGSTDNATLVSAAFAGHVDDGQGDHDQGKRDIDHVLLISVDGMHQSDLDWYVANHPDSTLAKLVHSGTEYANAATSNPSDSDRGAPR